MVNNNQKNNELANRFDLGVSFPIDVFNKTRDEINAEQKQKDQKCISTIEKALKTGLISEEYASALVTYYKRGMDIYKAMFSQLKKIFGEEDYIKIVDPNTGESLLEHAKRRHVTPNNCAVFRYRDRLDNPANPIYVTLPGIKDVERAIAKYKKYTKEYREDIAKLEKKGLSPEAYNIELANVAKPEERMRDVLRCSISVKYYKDVLNWTEHFKKQPDLKINPARTKNKFCDNDVNKAADFTDNNFRNLVFYMEIPILPSQEDNIKTKLDYLDQAQDKETPYFMKVEVQTKITALDEVDRMTHPFYEKQRVIKVEMAEVTDEQKLIRMRLELTRLDYIIKSIYRLGIEKHNQNEVLDKVARMEENHRIDGDKADKNGLYGDCIEFIQNNFLARPKQVYVEGEDLVDVPLPIKEQYRQYQENPETAKVNDEMKQMFGYYDKSPHLQKLFQDASEDVADISERYKDYIRPKYISAINTYDNSSTFIPPNDDLDLVRSDAEIEVLESMEKTHWRPIVNKYVANKPKSFNNTELLVKTCSGRG